MKPDQLIVLLTAYEKKAVGTKKEIAHTILFFLEQNPDNFWKRSFMNPGHITISAWVIDESAQHVLMMHHRGVNKWVQLGGHIDPMDTDVHQVALREVQEECGLIGTLRSSEIFDVGHHIIPARAEKHEGEHEHFDIRFLVTVPYLPPTREEHSTIDLQWIPITQMDELAQTGEIEAMIAQTRALQ